MNMTLFACKCIPNKPLQVDSIEFAEKYLIFQKSHVNHKRQSIALGGKGLNTFTHPIFHFCASKNKCYSLLVVHIKFLLNIFMFVAVTWQNVLSPRGMNTFTTHYIDLGMYSVLWAALCLIFESCFTQTDAALCHWYCSSFCD